MKKILFTSLTGYPNPSIGGPTRIIYELLKNLDYLNYEPFFLSYDMFKKYSSKEQLYINQKNYVYTKRRLGHKFYNKINFYKSIVTSDGYLKYHYNKMDKYFLNFKDKLKDFDIIHSHDTLSAYYFLELTKPFKILTVHSKGTQVSELKECNIKSVYFQKILSEFSKREIDAFLNYNLITFPGESAKEIFIQNININSVPSEKMKIVYNGINLEKINKIQINDVLDKYNIHKKNFDITLLNVAQHVKPKNIDLVIKSLKILNDEFNTRALLVNVGEGYMTNDYLSIIDTKNLNEQVKFLGMIPNNDVIRLMKALDIFIQPSEKVIFDLVVLEALACGIKVLVSDEAGNREVIRNNENGFLLSSLNEFNIARDIIKCYSANLNSSTLAESVHSIQSMSKNYEELYG